MSGMSWGTLGEVRNGSGIHGEVLDGSGDHWGGPGWVGGKSGRSGTGLGTLEEVRDWSSDT